ncbi:MAG: hypothetical protein E7A56_08285, partial [Cutibacterium avidum]|nr:hypothetical protein [Cutibacterium avidum]
GSNTLHPEALARVQPELSLTSPMYLTCVVVTTRRGRSHDRDGHLRCARGLHRQFPPQVKAVRLDRALAIVALFVTAAVSMPTVSAVGRPQLVTINAWDYRPSQSATPITVEYEDPFTGRSAKAQALGTQIQLSVPYPGPIPNLRITSPVEIDGNSYLMERRFQEEPGPYFHWLNVRQQFFNIATLGSVRDASPTITVQLTKS